MTTAQFSEEAKQTLIGRKIIEVGNNYIVLDNGLRIYLSDEEIQMLS